MRPAAFCLLTLSTAPVAAQVQRLVDTIESPIAYLCLEAMPRVPGAERQVGPVQRLLADPSLDVLFRAPAGTPASGSTRALGLVRGLLARSSGELELAMTGIVPSAGQPLLVLRARLQGNEAESLQTALDAKELATPSRQLGGRTVYQLRSETKATGPGQEVELALVGTDLVVGNDSSAMREVVEPPAGGTVASRPTAVLSADPRFAAMRQRLPVAPGALWMYGDWRRLGQRIEGSLDGLPGALMGSSGLGSARAVMASIASEKSDYTVTLLLDFDVAPAGPGAGRPPRNGGTRPEPGGPEFAVDGWFAAVEPTAARSLLAELPTGGLGGLVLSVDLASVARRAPGGAHLLHDLHRAFDDYGLDFDRNVLSRLGSRGTVQLHVDKGEAGAEVGAIYAVRTKNKKAAADLFTDLRRVCEPAGLAVALAKDVKDVGAKEGGTKEGGGKDHRTVDLLELRHAGPRAGMPLFVAAHEDSLLLSSDSDTLAAVVDDLRRSGKPRARRAETTAAAIAAIGGENVAGLFDVDLQPLFDQITSAFTGAGAHVDLSALPKRHVGYLDLQRHANGTVVRCRVLSSR